MKKQRVIKFRAWDSTNKRFEYFDFSGGVNEHHNDAEDVLDWVRRWNWPVMQFTGLTDRNGREVFEGDIVEHLIEFKEEMERFIGVVSWTSAHGVLVGDFPLGVDFSVIGNIHENGDLLL